MIQDAINELASLLDRYIEPFCLEIITQEHFYIKYSIGQKDCTKPFIDTVEMLEWMESNFTERKN